MSNKGTRDNPWVADCGTKLAMTTCDVCGKLQKLCKWTRWGWECVACIKIREGIAKSREKIVSNKPSETPKQMGETVGPIDYLMDVMNK